MAAPNAAPVTVSVTAVPADTTTGPGATIVPLSNGSDTHHTGPIAHGHAHDHHQPVVTTPAAIQPAGPAQTRIVPVHDEHGAPATLAVTAVPAAGTTGVSREPHTGEPVVYNTVPVVVEVIPANNRPTRGFVIGILSTIALAFWLVAMTTPIAMIDGEQNTTGEITVDPWHSCTRLTDDSVNFCRPMGHPDEPCGQTRDTFRVEQAFLLITGIMLIPLLTCAALDFSHKLNVNTPDLPFGLSTHGWMIFFAFMTALMSCVAFAIGFAIPRSNPCSNGRLVDRADFAWGPSPVFSLLVFVTSIVIIIVALVLREDGTVKTREEVMHPHHPNAATVAHQMNPNEPLAA